VEERTRYRFNKITRAMALLGELQAAGLHPGAVFPLDDGTLIDLSPAEYDAAATVVAAHDAAALDAIAAADQQQYLTDVAGLKAYQNVTTPTLAQTSAAVKALSRVLRRVVQELRN
jgi:hypothetical protein